MNWKARNRTVTNITMITVNSNINNQVCFHVTHHAEYLLIVIKCIDILSLFHVYVEVIFYKCLANQNGDIHFILLLLCYAYTAYIEFCRIFVFKSI
jgi:hypothetical protein